MSLVNNRKFINPLDIFFFSRDTSFNVESKFQKVWVILKQKMCKYCLY